MNMKKKYISEQKRLNIVITIWSSVSGMFCKMLNPKFRGENFKWNSDMIINHACDMVYVMHDCNNKMVRNFECTVKEYSRNLATEIYNDMLKNSNL